MNELKEPETAYLPEEGVTITTYNEDDLPELLASIGYEQFQVLEWLNSQAIAFRKWFVDISGDLVAGLMLSQIHYWHGQDEHGNPRLKVKRGGHLWLCKADNEWWDEIRITEKQARRARNILTEKGLIVCERHRFNNVPKTHIRINKPTFMLELVKLIKGLQESKARFAPQGESDSPHRANGFAPQGESLTKTTTKTTTEITNYPPERRVATSTYPVKGETLQKEPLPDLEYVALEEEERKQRPKWQVPDTPEQEAFLKVCKRSWFESKQKRKTKGLIRAFAAGDMAGDSVYQRVLDYIADKKELVEIPPLLPRTWYDFKAEHARAHRWSFDGFLSALLDRDKLAQHCQYHLKKMKAPVSDETTHTPLPPGWEAQEKPDYLDPESAYTLAERGMKFPPETLEKLKAEWKKRGLEWDEARLKGGG